jgi:ATP-dependent metalloprotease FtsH
LAPCYTLPVKSFRTLAVWLVLLFAVVVLLMAREYRTDALLSWITFLIPIVLVLAFLLYFVQKAKGGSAANIMSLRRSPHREISSTESRVTFADVGGCEEAKEALGDVIDFLKAPERWLSAGVRLPRGILLEGPPGCGKTLLARAVAGETNAKFFLVAGSEFVEMFVGVGAARVRDLFETATKKAPAVIFIDELDAVGRRRGSGIGGSHDEREQTLNQLLVCLDGFRRNDRVVVLAATNRPDVLDSALVRPGRIDRRIRVPELNEQTRAEVIKIHTRGKPLDGVNVQEIARMTGGFNGARLENLTNEAALLALRRVRGNGGAAVRITNDDFIHAMQPALAQDQRFNKLDSILIESASQLAEPTGTARVRLQLWNAPPVEGGVVWADASFLKIRRNHGESDLIVSKRQIVQFEVLDGTDSAELDEVQIDRWAVRSTETV